MSVSRAGWLCRVYLCEWGRTPQRLIRGINKPRVYTSLLGAPYESGSDLVFPQGQATGALTGPEYLGSWVLPSGNSVDVYLRPDWLGDPMRHVECRWDQPPSAAWPPQDVEHYFRVVVPQLIQVVLMTIDETALRHSVLTPVSTKGNATPSKRGEHMEETVQAESQPETTTEGAVPPDIDAVRATVEEHFPGLWPAVDLGLATAATLLLQDNVDPVAVIYVGGPSSGKTTVADMFADADVTVKDGEASHPLVYLSDNFTPAAFVSHAANVTRKKLLRVDLLPRIKHKLMVTPELAPIFRGKEADLTTRFSILTRILDGDGLMTDSGTHGQRGYRGDYMFAWLGCTTPFETVVWRVMAQLGSRLFFLLMDSEVEVTVEDLVASEGAVPYKARLDRVRVALHPFLSALFEDAGGVRGVTWDATADPHDVKTWIARFATVLAAMRSEPVREGDPERGRVEYSPAKTEKPHRAHAVLGNLARGHALVHGRRQVSEDDLPLLARVVVSSMPSACGRVFGALVQRGGEPMTTGDVKESLGVAHAETARSVMGDLGHRGVIQHEKGTPDVIRFGPEWEWCTSPEFQRWCSR